MLLQSDSQQFFLVCYIPKANFILDTHGEYFTKASWKADTSYRVSHCGHKACCCCQTSVTFNLVQAPLGCQSVYFLLRVGQTDDGATLEIDLFFEKHCFFIYTAERTACCRHYECTE